MAYNLKIFAYKLAIRMKAIRDAASNGEEDDKNDLTCFTSVGKDVGIRWLMTHSTPVCGNDGINAGAIEIKRLKRAWKEFVAVKPGEVISEDVNKRQIAEMKRVLKSKSYWNYWSFVLDPNPNTSFKRSVENIFHSSFLVKEHIAFLDIHKKSERISYIDPNRQSQPCEDGGCGTGQIHRSQFVMGFDRNTWLEKIRENKVTKCLLTSRK